MVDIGICVLVVIYVVASCVVGICLFVFDVGNCVLNADITTGMVVGVILVFVGSCVVDVIGNSVVSNFVDDVIGTFTVDVCISVLISCVVDVFGNSVVVVIVGSWVVDVCVLLYVIGS